MEQLTHDSDLFNKTAFDRELKEQKNHLSLFKKTLKSGYENLIVRFKSGEDIESLVNKQVWLVDQLLVQAWNLFIDTDDFTLIAVGGYGRAELILASDIDLMVVEKPRAKKPSKQQLEKFLTFLWDFGLEVGHSVRTVKECRSEAKNDITIITNIMESRLLCGNEELYEAMRKATAPNKIWSTQKFFTEKLKEQQARHEKYSDSANKLEPNIKESPGGLRDIQMISWVAKRHFDNINLSSLVKHNFLTNDEYTTLTNSRNLLWRIRFALHMLNKRREDRLLFEFQRNVAELLGFNNKEDNSGIEKFMKMYFKTINEISRLNEMLLQHFEEEIIYSKRKEKIIPINSRFQKRNDFIEVKNKGIFKRYPFALLEIFLLIQQDPKIKGVRASTIRNIRDNLYLINSRFRKDIRNRSLFMEIIKQPRLVGHKFRLMHRYGVLGAYMPSFAHIEGLMQFDMFHIYTVDEHTLTVIRNMRLFGTDEYQSEFPLCNEIIKKLPKLELLYLSGLFHDIAKGRGGDHSKLGAKDAYDFCKLHQLSDYDSKLVAWLVERHLLMSKTTQREDIDDPEVISNFANKVRDQTHLNYLHVLTVADICATNPELWNNWKGTLLTNLYHRTLRELRRGQEKPILKTERVKDAKRDALLLLKEKGFKENEINDYWKSFSNDYFLRHTTEEISWHIEGILTHKNPAEPLVLVKQTSNRGGSFIFVYMKNKDNIFAITTKAIEKLRLNVLDAKIITNRTSYTLDTFIVLEENGSFIKTKDRANEIRDRIKKDLLSTPRFPEHGKWIEKRQLKSFNLPTRVTFEQDIKNNRTIMEVTTIDRPGVLSRIGTAMALCGVDLISAKIATLGERVEDIFYIRGKDNHAIQDPMKFECLKNSIIDTLSKK